MKQGIKFFLGWFIAYLCIAGICWLANMKTMDYADALHNDTVSIVSIFFGWIVGVIANADEMK